MRRMIFLAMSALLLSLPTTASALVYGVKSQAVPGGGVGSIPPTHFFSFREDGSGLTDHGALKLGGQLDLNVDALAYCAIYGLRAYDLRIDTSFNVTGSRLISIDPNTLAVTVLSDFQDNRNMRGAAFINNELWVLDAGSSQLLKVNPLNGTVLATRNLNITLSDCCDLAVNRSGTVYLVNYDYATLITTIYTVDLATGQATKKYEQGGNDSTYVGAAFSMNAPTANLFAFDVHWTTTNDDIFVQNTGNFSRTMLYHDLIPSFNAGRGDLAAAPGGDVTPACQLLLGDSEPIYGVKSHDVPGGGVGSIPPTHFFSFREDGSGLTDHGALKLGGQLDLNVDALACSAIYGLRAYDLRIDTSFNVTGSRLISIDPNTLAVTALSDFQDKRNMRGAAFINNDLWVLDAGSSQLLKVNPLDGAVLATRNLNITLSDCCDLAANRSGTVYLVNFDYGTRITTIYTLDLATGQATEVYQQGGNDSTYVGAAFSMNAPAANLFAFDVGWDTTNDDIFVQNTDNFSRTLLYHDLIPAFNAGRGDLATLMVGALSP